MKYPTKKVTLEFNDIRSGHLPRGQRMLFIVSGGEIYRGIYSDGQFWDGEGQDEIPKNEVEGWAYMKTPNFDESKPDGN